MADEVIIQGWGDDGRKMPDFATEATLVAVQAALGKANVLNQNSTGHLAQIALGEKRGNVAMNKLLAEMRQTKKSIDASSDDQIKATEKAAKEAADADGLQGNYLKKLLTLTRESKVAALAQFKANFRADAEARKLIADNKPSDQSEGMIASLKGVSGVIGTVASGLLKVAVAVKGANNYFLQQGQERFNFAQELRQSGLAAGLETAGASMTGFADKVRENNFTLGEAAAFTQRFSKAVGVTGVDGAMSFVKSLAYAEDNGRAGGDMMQRFGMEFGEVANISGEYLESVRNLGMLDKMSNTELRTGMDDFMSTVVATSNVMKINMEDAAQMIKDTLSRDDITSLLATMEPEQAQQVQQVVGMAGGMQSELGEALAQRLAAGSAQEFQLSAAYQEMASSPIAMELLPVIERLAQASENGGTEGFQREYANLASDAENLRQVAEDNRVLLTSGADQYAMKVLSQILKASQTSDDADAGFTPLSADDIAAVGATEVSRQFTIAMEGVNTQLIKTGDFAGNISKLNEANLALIQQAEESGTKLVAQYADEIVGLSTGVEAGFKNAIASMVGAIDDGATAVGLFDTNTLALANNLGRINDAVNSTFGPVTGEIPVRTETQLPSHETSNVNSPGMSDEGIDIATGTRAGQADPRSGVGPGHGSEYNYPDPNAETTTEPVVTPIVEPVVLPVIDSVVQHDPIVPAPLVFPTTEIVDSTAANADLANELSNNADRSAADQREIANLLARIDVLENKTYNGRLGAQEAARTNDSALIAQLQQLVSELRK